MNMEPHTRHYLLESVGMVGATVVQRSRRVSGSTLSHDYISLSPNGTARRGLEDFRRNSNWRLQRCCWSPSRGGKCSRQRLRTSALGTDDWNYARPPQLHLHTHAPVDPWVSFSSGEPNEPSSPSCPTKHPSGRTLSCGAAHAQGANKKTTKITRNILRVYVGWGLCYVVYLPVACYFE